MSTTQTVTTVATLKANFDFTQVNDPEMLKAIQRLLTERKRQIIPTKEIDPVKQAQNDLAQDMFIQLHGFNKSYNLIKQWKTETGIQVPNKRLYTFAELGIENINRFNFLMVRFANILPFFSTKLTQISPKAMVKTLAKVTTWDDAKFATMQRSGMNARAKK